MSSTKQIKARHHYKFKVQSLGLIILQFAALVTHDLAVHAEQTRRTRGAAGRGAHVVHARSERGAHAARIFSCGRSVILGFRRADRGVSFSASVTFPPLPHSHPSLARLSQRQARRVHEILRLKATDRSDPQSRTDSMDHTRY